MEIKNGKLKNLNMQERQQLNQQQINKIRQGPSQDHPSQYKVEQSPRKGHQMMSNSGIYQNIQNKSQFHRQNYQLSMDGTMDPGIIINNPNSPPQQFTTPRKTQGTKFGESNNQAGMNFLKANPSLYAQQPQNNNVSVNCNINMEQHQNAQIIANARARQQSKLIGQEQNQQLGKNTEIVEYQQFYQQNEGQPYSQQQSGFQPLKQPKSSSKNTNSQLGQTKESKEERPGRSKKNRKNRKMSNSPPPLLPLQTQQHDGKNLQFAANPAPQHAASPSPLKMRQTQGNIVNLQPQQETVTSKKAQQKSQLMPQASLAQPNNKKRKAMHPSSLDNAQQQRIIHENQESQRNSIANLDQVNALPNSPIKQRVQNVDQVTVKDNQRQITLANFEELQRFLASQGQGAKNKMPVGIAGPNNCINSLQNSTMNLQHHQKNYAQINQQMLNQSVQSLNSQQIPAALFQMLQQQQIQQSQHMSPQKLQGSKKLQGNSPQHQNLTVYYQPTSINMPMSLSVMDNQYQQDAGVNMNSLHMVDMPGIHVAANNGYSNQGHQYMTPQNKSKNVKLKDPTRTGFENNLSTKGSKSVPQDLKNQYLEQQKLVAKQKQKNRVVGSLSVNEQPGQSGQNHPAELLQFNTQALYNINNHQVNGIPVTYKVTKKTEIIEDVQIQPQYQISYQQHQDFPQVTHGRGSKHVINPDNMSQKAPEAINFKKTPQGQNNQYEKDSLASQSTKQQYMDIMRQDLPRVPNSNSSENNSLIKRGKRGSDHYIHQDALISSQGQNNVGNAQSEYNLDHNLGNSPISHNDRMRLRNGPQMMQSSQFHQQQQNAYTREGISQSLGKQQTNASQPQILLLNQMNENRLFSNNGQTTTTGQTNFLPPLAGANMSQDTSSNYIQNEKSVRGQSHYMTALSPQNNTADSHGIQIPTAKRRGKSLPRGASQIESMPARNQVWQENTYGQHQDLNDTTAQKKNTTPLPSVDQSQLRGGMLTFAQASRNRRQEEILSLTNDPGSPNLSRMTNDHQDVPHESRLSQQNDTEHTPRNGGPIIKHNRQSRRESNLSNHIRPVMVQDLMTQDKPIDNTYSPTSRYTPNIPQNQISSPRSSSSRQNQNQQPGFNYENAIKKDFRTSELTHIDINAHVIEQNQKRGQLGQPREISPHQVSQYTTPHVASIIQQRGNQNFEQLASEKTPTFSNNQVGQHLHTHQENTIGGNQRPQPIKLSREILKSEPEMQADNEEEYQKRTRTNNGSKSQIDMNTNSKSNSVVSSPVRNKELLKTQNPVSVPNELIQEQFSPIPVQEIQRQMYTDVQPTPHGTIDQEHGYVQSPQKRMHSTHERGNSSYKEQGKNTRVSHNNTNITATGAYDNFGKRQNSQNPVLGYITQSPLNSPYPNQKMLQPMMPNMKNTMINEMGVQMMSPKKGMIQQHPQAVTVYTAKPPKGGPVQIVQQPHAAQRAHQLLQNSNAKITILNDHGTFHKQALTSFCTTYLKKASVNNWTPKIYRNGMSRRILVSKETLTKVRCTKPMIIIHLEGTIGYFDENKFFYVRERNLNILQALSHNFRIIAVSCESKKLVKRLCRSIHNFQSQKSFTFDAVYVLKWSLTGGWLNVSHILLDMAEEITEGHLEAFAASQVIIVTSDYKIEQNFYKADLREIFHCDREYFMGTKAPLLIRMQHARIRQQNSFCLEAVFQTIIALLCSSSLTHGETDSMYSYNERTSDLCIPMGERGPLLQLLPEKLKMFDKHISRSSSMKFIFSLKNSKHGIHFHKGFKLLSEIALITEQDRSQMNKSQLALHASNNHNNDKYGKLKLDWLDLKVRLFQWPVPMKQRLERLTQKMLRAHAEPPTGKVYSTMCKNDEAQKRFASYIKRNENTKKHIRKYKVKYWATHQIEEEPLGQGHATKSEVVETESEITTNIKVENVDEESNSKEKQDKEKEDPLPNSFYEGSDDNSSDIEQKEYNEDAPPIKYKMIDLKPPKEQSYGNQSTPAVAQPGNKLIKIDCRNPATTDAKAKEQRSLAQMLIDMCSKRQPPMMFQTIQAEHLKGAQSQQIESAVAELTAKLNEQGDNEKKRVQDIKKQYD